MKASGGKVASGNVIYLYGDREYCESWLRLDLNGHYVSASIDSAESDVEDVMFYSAKELAVSFRQLADELEKLA